MSSVPTAFFCVLSDDSLKNLSHWPFDTDHFYVRPDAARVHQGLLLQARATSIYVEVEKSAAFL